MARVKGKAKVERDKAVPERYVNRELSWLEFNRRVLAEAANPTNPIIERLKFLAIFESNLDEFYMVRVSGLIEQYESGFGDLTPDGLTPSDQLKLILSHALPMRIQAGHLFSDELTSLMADSGLAIRSYNDLTDRQQSELDDFFRREVFAVCTPLILHPNPSVPFISNRSLNLAVELADSSGEMRVARVKVPSIMPRLVRLSKGRNEFIMLEDLIAANLDTLFPGVKVQSSHLFRVIRDADVEIRELEAADLIESIEESLRLRRFGAPVRMDVTPDMPDSILRLLLKQLELDATDVFTLNSPLGLEFLWEFAGVDRVTLKFPSFQPYVHEALSNSASLFESIKANDILVHQPFDSFRSVETFVASAATDPSVIGIKQTLYRVGSESPIVESLLEAAEFNKQVAVMVELKARFDESNNLLWARALERAGVHLSYGFRDLKTHAKLCLVVRRERDGIHSYAHIGTGNYNPATARIYTDFGLFTDDPEITQDIAELFNYLTGFSKQTEYRCLLVAPFNLREGIIARIHREIKTHKQTGKGRIIFKLNSLVDPETIDTLYTASAAGVKIDLIVRGICCLRPEVPGLSDNIRVTSIVGRFLEHSRGYYFGNGGSPELFIGSADLMRRNLDRRIEVLTPVKRRELVELVHDLVLIPCLQDNVRAWKLLPDGTYQRKQADGTNKDFDVHAWLMKNPTSRYLFEDVKRPTGKVT